MTMLFHAQYSHDQSSRKVAEEATSYDELE